MPGRTLNIRDGNCNIGKIFVRIFKSEADYAAVLEEIEKLIDADPAPNTPEADRLDLLALLANDYEAKEFPTELPDAVEAIKFRMEQQDLAPRDLIPYIGSRGERTEVQNRKIPLTLSMVRALHERLHVPAKALIQQAELLEPVKEAPDWNCFPVRHMISRGWIDESFGAVQRFFSQIPSGVKAGLLWRKSRRTLGRREGLDIYALKAWTARILIEVKESKPPAFKKSSVTPEFMTKVAQLSLLAEGPRAARDFLFAHGIPLIIEPHLPHTYLDGAAILLMRDRPIIGMTLRHDRLDNFRFTLLHELAHAALHFDSDEGRFIDDLDVEAKNDPKEREADELAGRNFDSVHAWKKSPASRLRSPEAALHLAKNA